MSNETLKNVIDNIIDMNDPKYIRAMSNISHICQQKADVLTNIQAIQSQYESAQNKLRSCNEKLKELLEG